MTPAASTAPRPRRPSCWGHTTPSGPLCECPGWGAVCGAPLTVPPLPAPLQGPCPLSPAGRAVAHQARPGKLRVRRSCSHPSCGWKCLQETGADVPRRVCCWGREGVAPSPAVKRLVSSGGPQCAHMHARARTCMCTRILAHGGDPGICEAGGRGRAVTGVPLGWQ